jgi:hypothetical protein
MVRTGKLSTTKAREHISDEEHNKRIEAIFCTVDIIEDKEHFKETGVIRATKVIVRGILDRWMRKS